MGWYRSMGRQPGSKNLGRYYCVYLDFWIPAVSPLSGTIPFLSGQTASPGNATLQILCRLHKKAMYPDEYSWERLTDAKTGKTCNVFWFLGGTPSTTDGAL